MGNYVNHPTRDKGEFLREIGLSVSRTEVREFADFAGDDTLVCLAENEMFSAAGILNSAKERDYWLQPEDSRPKSFFLVAKADIRQYADHPEQV